MPPTLPHIEDNPMAVFLTEVGNNSAVYTNMIAIEPELPNFPTSAKGTFKSGSTIFSMEELYLQESCLRTSHNSCKQTSTTSKEL